jgi:hypothetical protein
MRPTVLGGALGVPWTRNPLHAGPNSPPEDDPLSVSAGCAASKAGSCAAEPREPGQVRKEAALSGALRVPQERLAGAGGSESAGGRALDGGVHGHPSPFFGQD